MAGRPERALDPGSGPVRRFAAELRTLRTENGSPTYREMARTSGLGASTLSQAAAGERLPTLPVVLAYARVCGGDAEEWEARWREAARQAAAEPREREDQGESPYRGLARFEPGDSHLFFGRDQLVERLLTLARSRRFIAVLGPSGSGKSSLLRAGLIPRLRAPAATGPRPAAVRVLTPGAHPLRTHEQRLVPRDADGETWLVVDQFEELYTLCTDAAERERFVERLLAAVDEASGLRVVIAVRADFLGHCTRHPGLTAVLQEGTVLAGPMSRDELRAAVVQPARAAGLMVERSLTARILDEVDGEPGALPLMSHALLETWRHRQGRALTAEAYEGAGGLHGALARTAETLYGQLATGQGEVARRVLLRLIAPGEGTHDARRPVSRAELGPDESGDVDAVVERLARARLITLDHDTIELAHEALITGWPRFHGWIDADRGRLRAHRRLTEAAQAWDSLERDPGMLYRGTRLADAEETFTEQEGLSTLESAFLAASLQARAGEQRATARTTRRLRALVAGLTALLLLAGAAAAVAFQQRAAAQEQRTVAVSRQIAAEADQLRGTGLPAQVQNASLAAQLDIASYRMRPSDRTYTSLLTAANSPLFTEVPDQSRRSDDENNAPNNERMAVDARRRVMAVAGSDRRVRLWDIRDATHLRRVGPSLPGSAVGLSADGGLLAAEDDRNGRIRLWDIGEPRRPARLATVDVPGDTIANTVALSPDGRLLATGGQRIFLWDLRDPGRPVRVGRALPGDLPAFSPHGHVLATAGDDDTVRLWNTAHPTHPRALSTLRLGVASAHDVVFSPDGRTLATARDDAAQVRLWNIAHPEHPTRLTTPLDTTDGSEAMSVAFSPDGRRAAVAEDNGVQLWDIARGAPARVGEVLGQPAYDGMAIAFGRDSRTLVTDARVMRVWSLPPVLPDCPDATVAGTSPDGRTVAVICDASHVQLWGTTRTGRLEHLTTLPGTAAALAPHGDLLAVAESGGGSRLWDIGDPKRPRRLGRMPSAQRDYTVSSLIFSANGRTLADYEEAEPVAFPAGSQADDGVGATVRAVESSGVSQVRMWNVKDPRDPRPLGTGASPQQPDPPSLALSPDGRTLALADATRKIRLWDTHDPTHSRPLPTA
ncbi:hypothetical protein, partial [Streptomyces kanamyceticus]